MARQPLAHFAFSKVIDRQPSTDPIDPRDQLVGAIEQVRRALPELDERFLCDVDCFAFAAENPPHPRGDDWEAFGVCGFEPVVVVRLHRETQNLVHHQFANA